MAIESNCGGRDFEQEWQIINPNFHLYSREGHQHKELKTVLLAEAYSVNPVYYNLHVLKQYKNVITWNSKFYNLNKETLPNLHLTQDFFGATNFKEEYINFNSFINYSDKINGICLVSNLKTYFDCNEGAIGGKRMQTMNGITGLIKHVYGGSNCGPMYQGFIGKKSPEYTYIDLFKHRYDKVQTLNKYKFNLCFENVYHELWSWDYITEKLWDAFIAKTVPIYYGCYNIEQRIPKDLYIDYRDFNNDSDLSNYLLSFPKDKYIEMTEKAYEYYKQMQPTFLRDLKELLIKLNNE